MDLEKSFHDTLRERLDGDRILGHLIEDGRGKCESEDDAIIITKALADLESRKRRVKAQYEAILRRIENERRGIEYFFQAALEKWAAENLPKKKRSIILPDATLKFTKTKARAWTESESTLRAWASVELPEAIHYERAPLRLDVIKTWEEKHGALAKGRIMLSAGESFKIAYPKEEPNATDDDERGNGDS